MLFLRSLSTCQVDNLYKLRYALLSKPELALGWLLCPILIAALLHSHFSFKTRQPPTNIELSQPSGRKRWFSHAMACSGVFTNDIVPGRKGWLNTEVL